MTRLPIRLAAAAGPPADAVRRAADGVFRRPEFAPATPSAGNWLLRQVAGFFRWLGGLYDGSPVLFWLLLVGCLVALVLLVALIVFQVRGAFAGGRVRRGESAGPRAERERRSATYRTEADRRAAAADYTEAVRFLFLSLVYRFDERGRVNFTKSYTNREYLGLVGDRAAGRAGLGLLVDALDDNWYGQRALARPQYEECRAVYDRLATTA